MARQQDEVILAHRLVLARKDPLSYLSHLQDEDEGLARWSQQRKDNNELFEAAVRIQSAWILRPWTIQASEVLRHKLVKRRQVMRRALLDIQEFRDDIKTQVFQYFGQIAPPLAKRVAEVKKRLSNVTDQPAKITSTKHPLFHSMREHQQDLLSAQLRCCRHAR